MGRRKLLWIMLITLIVASAAIISFRIFGPYSEQAKLDAVREDLSQIGAAAQEFYVKPRLLGGGGKNFADPEFTFDHTHLPYTILSPSQAENERAVYTIEERRADQMVITAVAKTAAASTIKARVCPDEVLIGDTQGNEPPECGDLPPVD